MVPVVSETQQTAKLSISAESSEASEASKASKKVFFGTEGVCPNRLFIDGQ